MRLSTWSVPRSFPSVGTRGHGIVQHRRRRTLTSALQAVSLSRIFYVVSLSWLLYASVFVDRPRLPTFLDPPWLLMSNHPSLFDRQVVLPEGTLVDLQSSDSGISAFKNCFFGGSLPSILPSLSSWQSSALYYDCCVPSAPSGHVLLGSFVPSVYNSDPLRGSDPLRPLRGSDPLRGGDKHCWAHGKIMGGSTVSGSIPGDQAGCYRRSWGEKVILIWIKRCSVYLLGCWSSRGEYGGCFHVEEFPRTIFGIC